MRRVISDPERCHGNPVFEGTRILVSVVLDSLAEGDRIEDLTKAFPPLTEEDILGAIAIVSQVLKKHPEDASQVES